MTTSRAHSRAAGGRRQRDEGNPTFSEAKSKPSGTDSKSDQRNPTQILGFPSPDRAFSMTYADPHGLFISCAASRLKGGHGPRRRCLFAPDLSFLLPSFRFLRYSRASEGLAPFRSRTLGRHLPDSAAAGLTGGNRGTLASSGRRPRTQGKRQGDRSDVRQEYVRLIKSTIRSRAFG
jgi:hypothetical protein